MKKYIVATLASFFATTLGVYADAYTFAPGTVIPLQENGTTASWVTTTGNSELKVCDTYLDSTKNGFTFTLSLNNSTAGDYVLSFLGAASGFEATFTVTVSDGNGYIRTVNYEQPDIGAYKPLTTQFLMILDDLPQGAFTLGISNTKRKNNTNGWTGNYGNFTITTFGSYGLPAKDKSFVINDTTSGLALELDRDTIKTTGTEISVNDRVIGSTHNNDTFTILFTADQKAYYDFTFDYSLNYGVDNTLIWTLAAPGETFSCTLQATSTGSDWKTYKTLNPGFGILEAGTYMLRGTCKTGTGRNWVGNFTNFIITKGLKEITSDYTLEKDEDWSKTLVTIASSVTINLNGHNLNLGQYCEINGNFNVTNSDAANLSSLTSVFVDGVSDLVGKATLTGNVRHVMTGTGTFYIGTYGEQQNTGGFAFSNATVTASTDGYSNSAYRFSQGTLEFIDSNVTIGSKQTEIDDPVKATGDNTININGNNNSMVFNGKWTGTGSVFWKTSNKVNTFIYGDMSEFEGTFRNNYKTADTTKVLAMVNDSISKGGAHKASFTFSPDDGVLSQFCFTGDSFDEQQSFAMGSLATDTSDPTAYTQTFIRPWNMNKPIELVVGARNEDTVFSAILGDSVKGTSVKLSLKKVGTGTLTLNNPSHAYTGTTTISEGKLVINNTTAFASAVTVASGATLSGNGILTGGVTVSEGGYYGGTLTADVAFAEGSFIDGSGLTTTPDKYVVYSLGTVTGNVTGQPSLGSAPIVGKGHWKLVTNTSDGTVSFGAKYLPQGLIMIVR